MASLRPGKKRGTSWGEGVVAASLGFGRAPSFFYVFFYFYFFVGFSGNGLLLGFPPFRIFFLIVLLRSVFIVLESLHV